MFMQDTTLKYYGTVINRVLLNYKIYIKRK